MKPVRTKQDFVGRYIAGEFGNRPKTWATYDELVASQYRGLVHARNRAVGGPTWYNVDFDKVARLANDGMYYTAMDTPDYRKKLQGEVAETPWGLYLYYTTVAGPMRSALAANSVGLYGIAATVVLHHFMCQRSLEWLEYLLEAYDKHVVEFSTYDIEVGMVPGYNTLFWEVRRY